MKTFNFLLQRSISITLLIIATWSLSVNSFGQIPYTSFVDGDWTNIGTWTPQGVPGPGDDVTINSGHTITLDMLIPGPIGLAGLLNEGSLIGTGTITADVYSGDGTIYGIPSSSIPSRYSICAWSWSGAAGADWVSSGSWFFMGWPTLSIPTSADDVVISTSSLNFLGISIPIIVFPEVVSSVNAKNLTLNTGATLDVGLVGTLQVVGGLNINAISQNTGSFINNGTLYQPKLVLVLLDAYDF